MTFDILFLDNRHILVSAFAQGAALAVIDCYRETHQKTQKPAILCDIISDSAALVLQLPPLVGDLVYTRMHMRCASNALRTSACTPHVPFFMDHSLRIVAVTLSLRAFSFTWWEEVEEELNIVIPVHVILSRLPRTASDRAQRTPRTVIPWAQWGTDARYMRTRPSDLYNSMYVTIEPKTVGTREHNPPDVSVVYDFEPAAALHADALRERGYAPGISPFSLPPPPRPPYFFADQQAQAAAPCRRVVTNVKVGWNQHVRLFEDGIMVCNSSGDSRYVFDRCKRRVCAYSSCGKCADIFSLATEEAC